MALGAAHRERDADRAIGRARCSIAARDGV
jgi:hypothetical protein